MYNMTMYLATSKDEKPAAELPTVMKTIQQLMLATLYYPPLPHCFPFIWPLSVIEVGLVGVQGSLAGNHLTPNNI